MLQKKVSGFIFSTLFIALSFALTGCSDFTPAPEGERTVEIGILLRKQFTEDPCKNPDRVYRHIMVLLPGDRIIGYNVRPGEIGAFRYIFMNSKGVVRELPRLKEIRRHYIDADYAQKVTYKGRENLHMVTVWVKLKVTPEQAQRLTECWEELKENTPPFRLWGNNCASRAAECFVKAGILPWGLPGVDRPASVLKEVMRHYPDTTTEEGYFGFDINNKAFMIPLACPAEKK